MVKRLPETVNAGVEKKLSDIITRELIFGVSKNKLQAYRKILNMVMRLPEIVNGGVKKKLSDNYNEGINFWNLQK